MKALFLNQYGDIGNTSLEEIPVPTPAPAEALVRVAAASVNPLDVKLLSGIYQTPFPLTLPYVIGIDFSGTIEETGSLISGWKKGDKVIGRFEPAPGLGREYSRTGAIAEYVAIPARQLAPAPAQHPLIHGAALPTAAGTAWQALFEFGNLRANQTVLIHAAAGGVGHFAVQLAKLAGAHVVATASEHKHSLVRGLGADEVIDYQKKDFSDSLQRVDLVLDTIGGDTQLRSYKVLRQNGILAAITAPPDQEVAKQYQVSASRVGHTSDGSRLGLISSLVESNKLRIVVDSIFPLAESQEALKRTASSHASGKVIISM